MIHSPSHSLTHPLPLSHSLSLSLSLSLPGSSAVAPLGTLLRKIFTEVHSISFTLQKDQREGVLLFIWEGVSASLVLIPPQSITFTEGLHPFVEAKGPPKNREERERERERERETKRFQKTHRQWGSEKKKERKKIVKRRREICHCGISGSVTFSLIMAWSFSSVSQRYLQLRQTPRLSLSQRYLFYG